jgi:maltooligosyltrehalose trehalohydrolase
MGEEYGETAHFPYFVSHTEKELIEAVRNGRKEEFASFNWKEEPPDPQDITTFRSARLDHKQKKQGNHRKLYEFYRELIHLRKNTPSLAHLNKKNMEVNFLHGTNIIYIRRWKDNEQSLILMNFGSDTETATFKLPRNNWEKILDSSHEKWAGSGSKTPERINSTTAEPLTLNARSIVVYLSGD